MPPIPDTTGAKRLIFPEGWYTAELNLFEEKFSREGSPYTNLQFKNPQTNQTVWGILSHKVTALWKMAQFKAAISMPDTDTDLEPYRGARLLVYVVIEEYEGTKRNKVTEYTAEGDTTVKLMDDTLEAMIDQPPVAAEQPETDDDLPF